MSIEPTVPATGEISDLTLEEKVDVIYDFIINLQPLITQASEELSPMLAKLSKNPMFKMLGL